jgi:serine/threonine protein kinase
MTETRQTLSSAFSSGLRAPRAFVAAPDSVIIAEKYLIERHLATGGMGELFVARHRLTTQRVALKLLDRMLSRDETSIERFLREMRLAAQIGHPALVQVIDAGVHVSAVGEPIPYLAMELLNGCDLARYISKGDVTQAEALDRVVEALDPIRAAHEQGVVHRDLKPENMFLHLRDDGSSWLRLLDFGIAREIDNDRRATMAGQALGTVYYMAPEQALDARSASPTADVWSLGAMMYQMLAGVFPFDGETTTAIITQACRDPHTPLSSVRPDLDARLTALVDRCLSKDKHARPADAGALARELAPLVADATVRATLLANVVNPETFLTLDPVARKDPFAELPAAIDPVVSQEPPASATMEDLSGSERPPIVTKPLSSVFQTRTLVMLLVASVFAAGLAVMLLRRHPVVVSNRSTVVNVRSVQTPAVVESQSAVVSPVLEPVTVVAPEIPVVAVPLAEEPVARRESTRRARRERETQDTATPVAEIPVVETTREIPTVPAVVVPPTVASVVAMPPAVLPPAVVLAPPVVPPVRVERPSLVAPSVTTPVRPATATRRAPEVTPTSPDFVTF